MTSTRKQRAREKSSRQSDVLSDLEGMKVMLGNCGTSEFENNCSANDSEPD